MPDKKIDLTHAPIGAPPGAPPPPTWEIPIADVKLPSRGLVYPTDSSMHGRESVEIRAMTAREEDILTSRSLLRQGKAMTQLIKSCLLDKSIDPEQLLVGDRNAILIAIRASGYGVEYETKIECPNCEQQFEHTFDLNSIRIISLSVPPEVLGVNEFSFQMPMSKAMVKFRLPTGADDREISRAQDKLRKLSGVDATEPGVTLKFQYLITSVNGNQDKQVIKNFIYAMPAGDSLALRRHMEKISPNVDVSSVVMCKSCGEETEVMMPTGADFFWPSAR